MSDSSRYYESSFKKCVIDFYLRNQPNLSFRSVANHFRIPGDHATVKRWYDRYNGNLSSLQHHHRSERAPILNKKQINKFITMVIRSHNRLSSSINYTKLVKSVREKTNTNLSLRTIQRYGNKNGIKCKKNIKRSHKELGELACDETATLRLKLQRVSNKKIIFLDETHQNQRSGTNNFSSFRRNAICCCY
ncbi:unnamed protein product [Rotaria sp. Silwood2]|nr:unnamed protein product [Rotaria sp. Silwood2]